MNKTRRRRQRRRVREQRLMELRNKERGYTSGDLARARGDVEEAKVRFKARRVTEPTKVNVGITIAEDDSVKVHVAPTPEEWQEMLAKAKSRKRGVDKIAKQFGFELVGEDKRDPSSYRKAA